MIDPIDPVAQFLGEHFGGASVKKVGSHQLELLLLPMEYYFVLDADLRLRSNFRTYSGNRFVGNLYDPDVFGKLGLAIESWRG